MANAMWLFVISLAGAAEPELIDLDGGKVRGWVDVSAPVHQVRALVQAPVALGRVTTSTSTITEVPDGECKRVTTETAHPIMPVRYVIRGCSTAEGYSGSLVESRQLRVFEEAWSITSVPGGSRIHYVLQVQSTFPLPSFVVRSSTRSGVYDSLAALSAHFGPVEPTR